MKRNNLILTDMIIREIIENAAKQREMAMHKISLIRRDLTPDLFKELFMIRAQQIMIEHKSPGEFIVDDDNREVINLLYYHATRNEKKINPYNGIILNGSYGCGKSVLIGAYCRVLNDIGIINEKIEEFHSVELADHIRLNGIIAYARKPLLIQDLGKEPNIVNTFGTVVNPISNLLAVRAEYGSLTFGSTNHKLSTISELYKEYIGKRIIEHVNFIFLPGRDRRPDYSINQPK